MARQLNEHEDGLINSFVIEERRERWRCLLGNPRKRERITSRLHHPQDFRAEFSLRIPERQQTVKGVADYLRSYKASEFCYVISHYDEVDGVNGRLDEMLDLIVGRLSATLVSCIPGRLVYLEPEETNSRFILRRS